MSFGHAFDEDGFGRGDGACSLRSAARSLSNSDWFSVDRTRKAAPGTRPVAEVVERRRDFASFCLGPVLC